ncbi:hypothetical protein RD792_009036 [Penstemon davidsonii]|uniref:Glycosyltransferase N-terminal domain-containing protein n=1 Tax=Penstemon davidsonii TaxID=160366 RepID=A0ABR0DAU4_9LAMI|nr:hypothetical protein RD792_009036 [Penstemon davidsonii]
MTVLVKSKIPHVLAVPFPAQGHVKPLMKLSRQIAKHGVKVTFVNTEQIHEKIILASANAKILSDDEEEDNIVLTSIPDGRGPEDDVNDTFKLLESLRDTMPGYLNDLIERINSSNPDEKISCVIADITIGWVLDTAEKWGAQPVAFAPPGAAALAILRHIPELVEEGKFDSSGNITNGESIILSENIPAWRSNELTWSVPMDQKTQKIFFDCSFRVEKTLKQAKWLLGNTFYELEPAACDLNPNLLPIGPLLETNISKSHASSFHPEDDSCLTWLNNKPHGSVVYISFGSLAMFSQIQLDELALGLELSGRAFLWVVRSDLANGSRAVYPDGFLKRVSTSGLGKIVEWAPQERVLSHSSIACFVSHCGWNSTIEGLSMGVPFLCWPYFSDQFHNQSYICDKWEIGLRIDCDENGIRTRDEIKTKIDVLLSDDGYFKGNALRLKEMAVKSVSEFGSSYNNFMTFIDQICG